MKRFKQRKGSIIRQVTAFFLLGVLACGLITFISQRRITDGLVRTRTEERASNIAEEVKLTIKEYPAYKWLIRYWYEHADSLDIEYDADFSSGTETENKSRLLNERYPGVPLKYINTEELQAMSEEDQKLYAEIVYSWITARFDQIHQANDTDYLFCVVTDDTYETQFFLFSAAEPGAVRGSEYEEVYTLGTTVTVGKRQSEAMRLAKDNSGHLADAGKYMDYYSYFTSDGDLEVLIGMTYNLSGLMELINKQTVRNSSFAMIYQLVLSALCLGLISFFVLRPLRMVQKNIRLYKETKESSTVRSNLAEINPRNEIGDLSADVSDLAKEIDKYMKQIEAATAEEQRVSTELALAARIQEDLLPNEFPAFPGRKDFDIYAGMDPAKEVGGDFYDFFLIDDTHLGLVIADVSGKGVPAALFMMGSKILVENYTMEGKSPSEVLCTVNEQICSHNHQEMFVTVWLGILDTVTGKIVAANAGHEYPAVQYSGGSFELLKDKHSFVIGGMDGIGIKEYELQLTPGSRLFLYTDGVPEATNADNRLFGTERMISALNEEPAASPEIILKNVRRRVDEFVQDAEQFDDLTMLCLEYKGNEEADNK
ncbi:MAG: serine/threonine-protein phosphatase [Oscillospiraceae bacterium]|nr:serine/threonine-protein phosphatase [Oscillospiraceae bacterium]